MGIFILRSTPRSQRLSGDNRFDAAGKPSAATAVTCCRFLTDNSRSVEDSTKSTIYGSLADRRKVAATSEDESTQLALPVQSAFRFGEFSPPAIQGLHSKHGSKPQSLDFPPRVTARESAEPPNPHPACPFESAIGFRIHSVVPTPPDPLQVMQQKFQYANAECNFSDE